MELIKDNVKVEWEAIGEGLYGDFNPKNPKDVEMLRFYVSVLRDGEWMEKEDASYCTCFPVNTTPEEQMAGLQILMDRFYDALHDDIDASVKKLGEQMSWISPDVVEKHIAQSSKCVVANDLYHKLLDAGAGGNPWAHFQLNDVCAEFIGQPLNADAFITSLLYRGEWHHTTQDKIRAVLEPYNGQTVVSTRDHTLASAAPTEKQDNENIWITVYKDSLGYEDDIDNLTKILVPKEWLFGILRNNGDDPEAWLDEYTADNTDDLARLALSEGLIRDCSNEKVKAAVLGKTTSLNDKIRSAEKRNASANPGKKAPKNDRSNGR